MRYWIEESSMPPSISVANQSGSMLQQGVGGVVDENIIIVIAARGASAWGTLRQVMPHCFFHQYSSKGKIHSASALKDGAPSAKWHDAYWRNGWREVLKQCIIINSHVVRENLMWMGSQDKLFESISRWLFPSASTKGFGLQTGFPLTRNSLFSMRKTSLRSWVLSHPVTHVVSQWAVKRHERRMSDNCTAETLWFSYIPGSG